MGLFGYSQVDNITNQKKSWNYLTEFPYRKYTFFRKTDWNFN